MSFGSKVDSLDYASLVDILQRTWITKNEDSFSASYPRRVSSGYPACSGTMSTSNSGTTGSSFASREAPPVFHNVHRCPKLSSRNCGWNGSYYAGTPLMTTHREVESYQQLVGKKVTAQRIGGGLLDDQSLLELDFSLNGRDVDDYPYKAISPPTTIYHGTCLEEFHTYTVRTKDGLRSVEIRGKPPVSRLSQKKEECAFCKNNGVESDHCLKDAAGIVKCPVLRKYNCPVCNNGGGDAAHTIKYCPLKKAKYAFKR